MRKIVNVTDGTEVYDPTYVPPPFVPGIGDVSEEARRRVVVAVGAAINQPDITPELARKKLEQARSFLARMTLLLADGGSLTASQRTRALKINALMEKIENIQDTEEALKVVDPIPSDYAQDVNWP